VPLSGHQGGPPDLDSLVGTMSRSAATEQPHDQQDNTTSEEGIEMTRVDDAEALFASALQPSDQPNAEQVSAAINASLRQHGGLRGCSALRATEYGDHPETASERMRWARLLVEGAHPLNAVAA